jgi:hypothetical protein
MAKLCCRQPYPPRSTQGVLYHVLIGHVGCINEGKFQLIFDAAQPLGPSRIKGKDVPEDFNFIEDLGKARQQPAIGRNRDPRTELWGFEYVSGLSAEAEARMYVPLTDSRMCVLNQT